MPVKAFIEITEGKPKERKVEVMFNPESYQLSHSVSYSEKKILGLDGPISQYIAGDSETLDMTLYFDTYKPPSLEKGESGESVAVKTKMLSTLVYRDGDLHRPPAVIFHWGALQFKGVITSVKESYTMFLSDGTPVRAKVDISFKSLTDIEQSQKKSPLESPDRTKILVVQEGGQLWNYAWEEYGNAERFREIAKANGIMNPLMIEPGMKLKLPAL